MTPSKEIAVKHLEYRDFDLLIERDGDRYRVRVSSLEGEVTSAFDRPFSEQELEEFLTLVGYSWEDANAVEEQARKFGGRLFDRVFDRRVYARLCSNLDEAKDQGKGLRIRLRLNDVPELADLPWEYLYDTENNKFLFLSSKTPLVRYLEIPQRIRPFRVRPPLRFLVMISNPADSNYSPLEVEKEWKQLNESLAGLRDNGQIELVQVEATASALQAKLREGNFHVFHFIGHGGFDKEIQDGFLVMSDDEFPSLSGNGLGMLLADHDKLGLVVLNACEGARGSRSNPFSGVAQKLVKYGIPAVISMQFQITDDAAIRFSKEFYKAIAGYYPVDAALAEARKEISRSKNRLEWGTPALYMRSSDGAIFEDRATEHKEDDSDSKKSERGEYDPNEVSYMAIITAITEGGLVPFLGARANLGDSTGDPRENPFPPSDDALAERLAGVYHPPRGEVKGLLRVSQFFAPKHTQQLTNALYEALTKYSSVPTLHELLARLPGILRDKGYPFPYQLIVTTNYDDALEATFRDRKEPFDLICYETEGEPGGRFYYQEWGGDVEPIKKASKFEHSLLEKRTVILKIHGAVDRSHRERRSYAVTEDDYIDYLSGKPLSKVLPAQLISKLRNSQFLFLGYRLLDWNLRIFCHRALENDRLPPNSWVIESEKDPLDEEFWRGRDIDIVNVNQKEFVDKLQSRLQALQPVGGV